MSLHVRYGSRLDLLAGDLAEQLAVPPDDPFEAIVVAVPTAGVRDWLKRRLASHLGVAANVVMPFPGRFLAAALGTPLDDDDPWQVDRLTWAVLDVLEGGTVDVPGWHRESGDATSRRYTTARRIADLFDRYATTRPQILQQWERGAMGDGTVGTGAPGGDDDDGADDGELAGSLDPALRWQYHLWRAVRTRIGVPSLAERLPALVGALRTGTLEPSLPSTIAMFGVGALAPSQVDILTALAAVRDVGVYVTNPSPVGWQRTPPAAPGRLVPRRRFDDDPAVLAVGHPLVRSWGRLATETAALVRGIEHASATVAGVDADAEPRTLLEHIQRDIRRDHPPTPYGGPAESTRSESIQVHACHGASRQLEVLRDVLGHLFEADPSLQPRDVLIVCPDLARFEPFARAVFQRGTLPVPLTVTDLSLGAENPVAGALGTIMRTVADRCTAVDVLAVAALEPVRRRLGITVDDLTRFATWAERLGANWGLDVDHRSRWLDVTIDAGTWESSLQSLLVGSAMPAPEPRRAFAGIVPFDDIAGADLSGAGRLAELIARLRHVRELASESGDVAHWQQVLVETLELLCAPDAKSSWQMAEVLGAIEDLGSLATVGGRRVAAALEWSDVRGIVDAIANREPGRLSLRSGRVTMSGMVPVRNVPAKVVCLLGFDEVSLRSAPADGDDLLAVRPCVGERDRRREQRQLVLDAVMAAEQHLVVVCDGADITTNRRMRFPVQLTELLDVVAATLATAPSTGDPANVESPVLRRHPRRSYDPTLFTDDGGGAFSFDSTMEAAATEQRAATDRTGALAPLRWAVDVPIPADVTLEQLTEACTRPARTLLRSGLDVRLPGEVAHQDMNIPLSVSRLESANMGERLLDRFRDVAADDGDWERSVRRVQVEWSAAEALRAGNPPGRLVEQALGTVADEVAEILAAIEQSSLGVTARDALGARDEIDIDLTLRHRDRAATLRPDGVASLGALRLADTVGGVTGNVIARVRYRRPRTRHVVGIALELAAVVAATRSTDWRGLLVTRGERGTDKPKCQLLTVVGDPSTAAALLDVAADLRAAALRGAVPLFEETSRLFHTNRFIDEDKLFGNDFITGDLSDDDTGFVWGSATMTDVLACDPSFGDVADLLWGAIGCAVKLRELKDAKNGSSGE